MDVDVLLAEEVGIDAVAFGVGAHPGQRRGHRFLHHFAEMPGHGELLAAAHAAGFDEDDVAADGRPDQSDRNAGRLDALLDFPLGAELRHAQRFVHHLGRDHQLVGLALGDAPRLLSDERGDLAFEVAHAGFARVAVNDLAQAVVGELDLLAILSPCSFACLGIRYLLAMWIFSISV